MQNKDRYFNFVMLIERLHRLFLDVVKVELDRKKIDDITNVQSLILYNVGHNKLTVGEITNRGYYLGSNVTYNLKKMVESGYLIQEQSAHDKRSSHVRLSEKGQELFKLVEDILDRHLKNMERNNISDEGFDKTMHTMERMESFWSFMVTRELRF